MPALISLLLTFNTKQEERLNIRGHGFPCLKELYIYDNYGAANLLFEEGALPKLEKFDLPFLVLWTKSNGFYLGIGHLLCLKYAIITLRNDGGASRSENRAAAAAIKNEANAHSNHLRLIICGEMEEDEEDSDTNEEEFEEEIDTNEEES
jgi:disease resistance protein RPM1